MWRLQNLLFIFCIALRCVTSAVGVIHVTGYVGREVNVSCSYDEGYESYEKYLCKNDCDNTDVLITTSKSWKSKYTIHDDKTARTFTTTIFDLRSADVGKYWCGVTRTGKDIYTEVELQLVQEWCCVISTQTNGTVGHPLVLQCPYPPKHWNNRKFLCKGDHRNNCTDMLKNQSRFTLQDVSSNTFFVIISKLEAADAGTYWCGSDSQWRVGNYTKIQLSVFPQSTLRKQNPALYVIPPVLLLICILVLVYKCRRSKIEEAVLTFSRNASRKKSSEEVIGAAQSEIYKNQGVVTSKDQSTCNVYEEVDVEVYYENLTAKE